MPVAGDDAAGAGDEKSAREGPDAFALLLRTEAAILLDDFPGAIDFGQRAFWQAGSDGQRFNAARLTALGYARQMQDTRAQLWLRAARQFAPSDAAPSRIASMEAAGIPFRKVSMAREKSR